MCADFQASIIGQRHVTEKKIFVLASAQYSKVESHVENVFKFVLFRKHFSLFCIHWRSSTPLRWHTHTIIYSNTFFFLEILPDLKASDKLEGLHYLCFSQW